jgi:Membrane dipeptidase (Peptidase family M19)
MVATWRADKMKGKQNVTAELLRHGYSERDIGKLWGGNFLRVWGEAQKAGRRCRCPSMMQGAARSW